MEAEGKKRIAEWIFRLMSSCNDTRLPIFFFYMNRESWTSTLSFCTYIEWNIGNEGLANSIYVFGIEWPCILWKSILMVQNIHIQNGRNGIYVQYIDISHKQPFSFPSIQDSVAIFFSTVEICVSRFITEQNVYNAFSATVVAFDCLFWNYSWKWKCRLINWTNCWKPSSGRLVF